MEPRLLALVGGAGLRGGLGACSTSCLPEEGAAEGFSYSYLGIAPPPSGCHDVLAGYTERTANQMTEAIIWTLDFAWPHQT